MISNNNSIDLLDPLSQEKLLEYLLTIVALVIYWTLNKNSVGLIKKIKF